MGCTAKQTMEGSCTDYRGLSKSEREERIKKDLTNKQLEKERIKQLSIARDGKNKINFTKGTKNYLWLMSIGVAVLSYKFAKSNKEFYAFVGFLSPSLIMFARSKYEKKMRDEKMKIAREKRNSLAQA
tara:strand:+ start:25 stop:408 length:384 start_codon:yes stop_codon:yes gene_type:complete